MLDEIRSLRNITQGIASQDLLNEGAPEMDYSLGIYQAIGTRSKPLARTFWLTFDRCIKVIKSSTTTYPALNHLKANLPRQWIE